MTNLFDFKFNPLLKMLLIALVFASCQSTGPRGIHVPLFKEKGELQATANINPSIGAEAQLDYAIGKRSFLFSDVSYSLPKLSSSSEGAAFFGSFGGGGYHSFGKRGVFSYYLGGTYGTGRTSVGAPKYDIYRPHIGVNVGWRRPKFENAFSLRSGMMLTSYGTFVTVDPAWTMRAGGERWKFQTQMGFRIVTTSTAIQPNVSVGMVYKIPLLGNNE